MSCFEGKVKFYDFISLDRFDKKNLDSKMFFLSHCHQDHMIGLDSDKFEETLRQKELKLFCGEITKSLVLADSKCRRLAPFIEHLPISTPCTLHVPDSDEVICVTLLPAYHCVGSNMILIEGEKEKERGTVLYTGDFRLCREDLQTFEHLHYGNSLSGKVKPIDYLYLDTTFCARKSKSFPSRKASFRHIHEKIEEWLSFSNEHKVLLYSPYKYGHEYLYTEVAKYFSAKVHVTGWKADVFANIETLSDCITNDGKSTRIHACAYWEGEDGDPTTKTSGRSMLAKNYCPDCHPADDKVLSIIPTAMYFVHNPREREITRIKHNQIRICYSMHSSLNEVKEMIKYLQPTYVEPNVYSSDMPPEQILETLRHCLSARQQDELYGPTSDVHTPPVIRPKPEGSTSFTCPKQRSKKGKAKAAPVDADVVASRVDESDAGAIADASVVSGSGDVTLNAVEELSAIIVADYAKQCDSFEESPVLFADDSFPTCDAPELETAAAEEATASPLRLRLDDNADEETDDEVDEMPLKKADVAAYPESPRRETDMQVVDHADVCVNAFNTVLSINSEPAGATKTSENDSSAAELLSCEDKMSQNLLDDQDTTLIGYYTNNQACRPDGWNPFDLSENNNLESTCDEPRVIASKEVSEVRKDEDAEPKKTPDGADDDVVIEAIVVSKAAVQRRMETSRSFAQTAAASPSAPILVDLCSPEKDVDTRKNPAGNFLALKSQRPSDGIVLVPDSSDDDDIFVIDDDDVFVSENPLTLRDRKMSGLLSDLSRRRDDNRSGSSSPECLNEIVRVPSPPTTSFLCGKRAKKFRVAEGENEELAKRRKSAGVRTPIKQFASDVWLTRNMVASAEAEIRHKRKSAASVSNTKKRLSFSEATTSSAVSRSHSSSKRPEKKVSSIRKLPSRKQTMQANARR